MTDTLFELEPDDDDMLRTADLSPDGLYRWHLWRGWGNPLRHMTFVMLNPSTADALVDDPTIRRCIGFARSAGLDGIDVVNLYAYRATNPDDLWLADDPVGGRNNAVLGTALERAARLEMPVVAAWSPTRARTAPHADRLTALHVTKAGAPGHPLYLPATSTLSPWPVTA